MLFTFNYFWKFLLSIIGAWILYGAFGYEFTMITLITVLIALNLKNSSHIL